MNGRRVERITQLPVTRTYAEKYLRFGSNSIRTEAAYRWPGRRILPSPERTSDGAARPQTRRLRRMMLCILYTI